MENKVTMFKTAQINCNTGKTKIGETLYHVCLNGTEVAAVSTLEAALGMIAVYRSIGYSIDGDEVKTND